MTSQGGSNFINPSTDYIRKTWIGKLKCAELVCTLLCGAFGSSVMSHCPCEFGIFIFVAWTAFISALIDMIIHLLGLWERLWNSRHPVVFAVLCAEAVVGFLIGSSLGASCRHLHSDSRSVGGLATIFGFVCLGLFAVEGFLHLRKYRGMQEEVQHQSPHYIYKPLDNIEPPPSEVV